MKNQPTFTRFVFKFAARAFFLAWLNLAGIGSAIATQVWTGPTLSFVNADGSDPTDAANQDRITAKVWLTRGGSKGIFNAQSESAFLNNFSPSDTEWATGNIADYATLTYIDWADWTGHNPPGTVGVNAVLHLISDDIYLSIKFTSWGMRTGGFAYDRSTGPAALPAPPSFQTMTLSGNQINLSWLGTLGQNYQFQYSTNLLSTNWISLGSVVTSTNTPNHFIDTNSVTARPQRYYRIVGQ